jgi:tetratricopeptide (TPR) repeat protein
MTRTQIYAIVGSVFLALSLYIGCETTPVKFRKLEKSRSLSVEQTDVELLLQDAKSRLSAAQNARLELLEKQLESGSLPDSVRGNILQELSGAWFTAKSYALAGYYAQLLAEQVQDGASWGIAGATFAIGLQQSETDNLKSFCAGRAISAFEYAISLDPDEVSHKINLALVYTERPPQDNPMKGIQQLLELEKAYPESAGVYFHLGRLAMRTGQYARAVERLEKATALDDGRKEAFCLLQEAYEALGETDKAASVSARCNRNEQADVQ